MRMICFFLAAIFTGCVSSNPQREISSVANEDQEIKSSHIRFWRGMKQDGLSQEQFQKNLIQRLIPETIKVGQGRGLISYIPIFPKSILENKEANQFLPDEIAIIQYADEPTYKRLAATDEFKKYGPLHYEPGAFVKKNLKGLVSGSLVSKTINSNEQIQFLKDAFAVDYGNVHNTWQNNDVYFEAFTFASIQEEEKQKCSSLLLNNLKNRTNGNRIEGFVLMYDPNYLLVLSKHTKNTNHASLTEVEMSCFQAKGLLRVPGDLKQMPEDFSGINFIISK